MNDTHQEPVAQGYRDDLYGPELRRRSIALEVRAALSDERVRAVYVGRCVRGAVGAWLVACAAVMALCALLFHHASPRVLVAAWAGAPFVAAVAWVIARVRSASALREAGERAIERLPLSGDREAVTSGGVAAAFAEAGAGHGRAEGLALAGVSLMAPLALHLAFTTLTRPVSYLISYNDFGSWIRTSLAVVGHCHLALAYLGWRHARRVGVDDHGRGGLYAGASALGWTMLIAAFPGALLLGVPVLLVGVTGAAFVPLSWWWASRRIRGDRATLAAAIEDLR